MAGCLIMTNCFGSLFFSCYCSIVTVILVMVLELAGQLAKLKIKHSVDATKEVYRISPVDFST